LRRPADVLPAHPDDAAHETGPRTLRHAILDSGGPGPVTDRIYKIARPEEWAEAEASGSFGGSADDRRDGFLHFSTAGQVRETVARHFSKERELLLIVVRTQNIVSCLRWEISRGGEKFPHLYGVLPLTAVDRVTGLIRGADGAFAFPAEIP
jgi:uncharacterized protein (DUF952 family)